MSTFKKEHIVKLLEQIVKFADENLQEINNHKIDINDQFDSTYVGLIIRQFTLCNDIKTILVNKTHKNFTSEFILFRCIIDDFIHFIYIVNQENPNEVLTNFNADAVNKNFNKIFELARLNEEKLGGNYPFYPTYALMEEVKEKTKQSRKRQDFFLDKEQFKFKTFKSTGNLIRDINDDFEYSHPLRRAYFIWRKLSDFVHYSNFTFEEEFNLNPENDPTFDEFSEIISYAYYTILNGLKHFTNKYNHQIVDSQNLAEYYKDIYHKQYCC